MIQGDAVLDLLEYRIEIWHRHYPITLNMRSQRPSSINFEIRPHKLSWIV
jgi:hypothetical protein